MYAFELKPPLGVMPYRFWVEAFPSPRLEDLLNRYVDVNAAIERYRSAGMDVPFEWLEEVTGGVTND